MLELRPPHKNPYGICFIDTIGLSLPFMKRYVGNGSGREITTGNVDKYYNAAFRFSRYKWAAAQHSKARLPPGSSHVQVAKNALDLVRDSSEPARKVAEG